MRYVINGVRFFVVTSLLSSCALLSSHRPVVVVADESGGPTVVIEREVNDGQSLTLVGTVEARGIALKENVLLRVRGLNEGNVVFVTERFLDELVDGQSLEGVSSVRFGLGVPSEVISQYELEVVWGEEVYQSPAQLEIKTIATKIHEVNPCPPQHGNVRTKKAKAAECKKEITVSLSGTIENLRSWPVSGIALSMRQAADKPSWLDLPSFERPALEGVAQPLGDGVVIAPRATLPFDFSLHGTEDWDDQTKIVLRAVKARRQ